MTSPAAVDPVEYVVDLDDRHAHLYRVEARFPVGSLGAATPATIDLQLPAWTPGSYLIREYARHVQEVACDDGDGRALEVRKVDKATWRVTTDGARTLRVRYRVYAHELTVRTSHLDDSHGFWNGACLYLYVEALRARPARVRVLAPDGWRATVALPAVAGEPSTFDVASAVVTAPSTFEAASHDELVDSPFEVGTHELVEFTAQGRPHRLAIWGRVETPRDRLCADITRIVDTAAALFGGVPYRDYTFLLLVAPNAYGGLEHARSATLLASPYTFSPRKKYEEFLELVSHEFFHLWNVKRIHPSVLGPFDYQREAYTRSLWVMEGVTSYYDRYLLVRAGLKTPAAYLEKLAEELGRIAATPGRLRQSLEESSFDAWIKLYRPDENTANSTISYYLKGGVVALLLDLELRARSAGRRSLDDVMRLLWERYGSRGQGFDDAAVQGLVEEASGVAVGPFFDRYVRGREELEVGELLGTVGLQLTTSHTEGDKAQPAWLGITTRMEGARLMVASALDGGPATRAGLYAGDELVALDGMRLDEGGLKERLAARRPGQGVRLTVFRRDELRTVELTLAARPHDKHEIAAVDEPTAAQRAAFAAWMGSPLDSAFASAAED